VVENQKSKSASGDASHRWYILKVNDTKLVVSARKSRGADFWDKNDYDVRLGDKKRTSYWPHLAKIRARRSGGWPPICVHFWPLAALTQTMFSTTAQE
jgi:hypothetical protein